MFYTRDRYSYRGHVPLLLFISYRSVSNVIINSVKRNTTSDPVSTVHEKDHSCLQVSMKFAD